MDAIASMLFLQTNLQLICLGKKSKTLFNAKKNQKKPQQTNFVVMFNYYGRDSEPMEINWTISMHFWSGP